MARRSKRREGWISEFVDESWAMRSDQFRRCDWSTYIVGSRRVTRVLGDQYGFFFSSARVDEHDDVVGFASIFLIV